MRRSQRLRVRGQFRASIWRLCGPSFSTFFPLDSRPDRIEPPAADQGFRRPISASLSPLPRTAGQTEGHALQRRSLQRFQPRPVQRPNLGQWQYRSSTFGNAIGAAPFSLAEGNLLFRVSSQLKRAGCPIPGTFLYLCQRWKTITPGFSNGSHEAPCAIETIFLPKSRTLMIMRRMSLLVVLVVAASCVCSQTLPPAASAPDVLLPVHQALFSSFELSRWRDGRCGVGCPRALLAV